jgi:hypothetical protein
MSTIYEIEVTDFGITQQSLCDRFEWSDQEVRKTAQYLGMTICDYLQAKTGWILRVERYYPHELGLSLLQHDLHIRQSRKV